MNRSRIEGFRTRFESHIKCGDYVRARRLLQSNTAKAVFGSSELQYLAGKMANFCGDYEAAFMHLRAAIEPYRNSGVYWCWVADTVSELGKLGPALQFVETAIELLPKERKYIGWEYKGYILWLHGKLEEAVDSYRKALRLSKHTKELKEDKALRFYSIAALGNRLGRRAAAGKAIKRAISLCPQRAAATRDKIRDLYLAIQTAKGERAKALSDRKGSKREKSF